ncbi:MAG: hypothetical protein DWQ02_02395 [Bacteroidetes bacterium]|nr:MAG: hypothetical protein DWQ02_02395 [Bacteroidota bacterium]
MKNLYFFPVLFSFLIFSCGDKVGDISGKWEYYRFAGYNDVNFGEPYLEFSEDSVKVYDFNRVVVKYAFHLEKDSLLLKGTVDSMKFSISREKDTLLIDSSIYVRNDNLELGKEITLAGIDGDIIFPNPMNGYLVRSFGIYHQSFYDDSIDENRVFNLQLGDKVSSIEDLPLFLDYYHRTSPAYINIYPDKMVTLKQYLEVLMTMKYSGYNKVNVITSKPALEKLEGFRETKTYWKDELAKFEEYRLNNAMPLPPPLPPTPSESFTLKQFIKEIKPLSIIHLDKSGYYFINQSLKSFPDEVMLDDSAHYLFVCDEAMSLKTYGQFRIDLQRYLQSRKETFSLNLFFKPFNELTIDQKREIARKIPKVFFVGKSFFEEFVN